MKHGLERTTLCLSRFTGCDEPHQYCPLVLGEARCPGSARVSGPTLF